MSDKSRWSVSSSSLHFGSSSLRLSFLSRLSSENDRGIPIMRAVHAFMRDTVSKKRGSGFSDRSLDSSWLSLDEASARRERYSFAEPPPVFLKGALKDEK